ncbi:MAG: polysaccharide deacetylase family protein [Sphingomonas sp.]
MRPKPIFVTTGAVALFAAILFLWGRHDDKVYTFPGLVQPDSAQVPAAVRNAAISDFDHGSVHRLAVLVTDPSSGWLGLVRGLRAHGIPFTMTRSVERALTHRVVFVYPMISGRALGKEDLQALARHVHDGGSVLANDVEGGGLQSLFGVAGAPQVARVDAINWVEASGAVEDRQTRISRVGSESAIGALAYEVTDGVAAARYDDGRSAIICKRNAGQACVMGVDLGALSDRAYNGRGESIARSYVNAYEPSLDTLYEWLAKFYVEGEPAPWLVGTSHAGNDFAILLTHDIDTTAAVGSALTSANALKASGVNGTFFIQTKYVRDYNDDVFFNDKTVPLVSGIRSDGMEIGSHSVSHSVAFKSFPFSGGNDRYPDYVPFVATRTTARDGTVIGELSVSKFLLDRLAGAQVDSFRAGHLSDPFRLPDGLAQTKYSFDSSVTANASLTHLPFQLSFNRASVALAPVYEFPVTIEDEALPKLAQRINQANQVIAKIAEHHGLAVILMHPDAAGRKLAFEQALIAKWKGRAWFASMRQYGEWWRARDTVDIDMEGAPGNWTLVVQPGLARDLLIQLPKLKTLRGTTGNVSVLNTRFVNVRDVSTKASISFD